MTMIIDIINITIMFISNAYEERIREERDLVDDRK